jgi:hypothetical protein
VFCFGQVETVSFRAISKIFPLFLPSVGALFTRKSFGTQVSIMDQMLPSPSFNFPSIGTPHHAMEEDQMINPQAQEAQQRQAAQVPSKFHKFTVLLSVGCLCTYANQISLQPSTKRRALFTAKSVDSDTGKSFFL